MALPIDSRGAARQMSVGCQEQNTPGGINTQGGISAWDSRLFDGRGADIPGISGQFASGSRIRLTRARLGTPEPATPAAGTERPGIEKGRARNRGPTIGVKRGA